MNKIQFKKATNLGEELTERWFIPFSVAMNEFGITGPDDQAMFIAQVGYESAGFTRTVENLNYSPDGLKATFGKYFTAQTASQYGRTEDHPANQRGIASIVYANRMGNRGQDSGDGWKYRGRGLIQITVMTITATAVKVWEKIYYSCRNCLSRTNMPPARLHGSS
nr:hypothetical protein Ef18B006LT_28610 [Escherichia fergusonii]